MFKRVRQLHISLAAKCQLLFGAAVVLIIGAALSVPWHRIEQLTDQLNERAARTLTDYAVADHVAHPAQAFSPTRRVAIPATTQPLGGERGFSAPRLILADRARDEDELTPFERRALHRLRAGDREWIPGSYDTDDGTKAYRFARIDMSCARCHSPEGATTHPTTAVAATKIVGIVSADIPSQIETNQLLLNRVFILSAGLLAGTLAIVVFYLITTRLILQPVRVLQETAQRVSQGDLNIRSDINTGDEFQQLSVTFNEMLANLKESADQLRAANKSLDLQLGQLAEANMALYASNRLKSEFLANVSHELRTPLNSILGFAELLRDAPAVSDPKAFRYIQNIMTSGRNLLDLINDLLDLAKIEAGKIEIRSARVSLADLFEGLISLLKPLSEARQLTIVPNVAADAPIILTDAAKLQQILYNLLANAIKFSPPGEKIALDAGCVEDGVRISVTDQGPGIPGDQHEVIFEKFRQADASVTRTHSGTGLGLAISRELTSLLGGELGLRSEPGAGSTFWIILPLKNEAGTEDMRPRLVLSN